MVGDTLFANRSPQPGPSHLAAGYGIPGRIHRSVLHGRALSRLDQTSSVVQHRRRGCSRRRSGSRRAPAAGPAVDCSFAPVRVMSSSRIRWPPLSRERHSGRCPARLLLLCLLLRSSWLTVEDDVGRVSERFRDALVGAEVRRGAHDPLSTFRSSSLGGFGRNVSDARVAVPSQQWGAACWGCAAAVLALSGWSRMPSSIGGCVGRGRRPRCGWLRLSWRGFA